MKKISLFFIALLTLVAHATQEEIVLNNTNQQHSHSEYYPPADMPEVYFNADDMVIIIEADGFANYYDVDIISLSTMFTDISTLVGGYGGDVDVSSLAADEYKIVITSSNNNVFEGYFTVE